MISSFRQAVNRYIHAGWAREGMTVGQLRQGRLLVLSLHVLLALGALVCLWAAALGQGGVAGIVALSLVGYALALGLFRRGASLGLAGNLAALGMGLGIASSIALSGGFSGGAAEWLVLLPIFAGLYAGARAAAAWAGVAGLTLAGFALLEAQGLVLPNLLAGASGGPTLLSTLVSQEQLLALVAGLITVLLRNQRWAEAQLTQAISALEQEVAERREAEAAAQAADRAKSAFLATVSHELRTPLNGVLGMTQLLLGTGLSPDQREYARTIAESGQGLLALLNEILDFSKIEAGHLELERSPFGLRACAEGAAELMQGAAREKGLALIVDIDADVPDALVGDAARLRQVLLNLLGNAVKFTDRGGIALRLRAEGIEEGSAAIRIEVEDTGVGVPPEAHARLFEAFIQADSSTTRRHGGTGLGLAIVRSLVHAMGGEVGVRSQVGVGSTFWFTVTLARDAAQPQDLLRGQRIVVVDDNPFDRLLLVHYLRRWGVIACEAESGEEALALMRAQVEAGAPPDAALLDVQMAGMDGLELAAIMQADPALAGVRRVVCSAIGERLPPERLRERGICAQLHKPLQARALRAALLAQADGQDALSRADAPSPPARPPLRPVSPERLLLVEDNPVNLTVMRHFLERLGYAHDEAYNGLEAVARAQAGGYRLVLMDVQMPVMDGLAATRAIRALPGPAAALPIIGLTAGAMDEDRDRCLAAGMSDYLSKPLDLDKLRLVLERWCGPQLAAQQVG